MIWSLDPQKNANGEVFLAYLNGKAMKIMG